MTDDDTERKACPIFSGVLQYFPDAIAEVAAVSKVGNDQHNPGQPLHWAKEKSRDEVNSLTRHLMDAGTRDKDGMRHSAKVAWRALALLQREIEREQGYDYNPETDKWEKVHTTAQPLGLDITFNEVCKAQQAGEHLHAAYWRLIRERAR